MAWCMKRLYRLNINKFQFCNIRLFSNDNQPDDKVLELLDKKPQPLSQLLQASIVPEERKKVSIDPDDRNVLLFPGQGTQCVGMVNELLQYPSVKEMFDVASQLLHFDLLNYCQYGPQSELDKTVHSQPAVVVTSLAGVEKIQATEPAILENCVAAAGYSVGEFAALVFAGVLTFEEAIKLVGVRSRAMQRACDIVESKMITAIGNARTQFKLACLEARQHCADELAMENVVCNISAYLCPNTVTIAGHDEAVRYVCDHAQKFNIRKILPIPVSGAFHTDLMTLATLDLKEALKAANFQEPLIQLYCNVTGKKYKNATEIRTLLPKQVVEPVKWEQIVSDLLSRPVGTNMPNIYEVGPGKQLGSLLKKCNGKAYKNYMTVSNL